MANAVITNIILKQIACSYIVYRNDKLANESDDVISFDMYLELFTLNLQHHKEEIIELCEQFNKECKKEKKKKRGNK